MNEDFARGATFFVHGFDAKDLAALFDNAKQILNSCSWTMMRIGTMNINRGGVSKSPAIAGFLRAHLCNIMALQEVDVNSFIGVLAMRLSRVDGGLYDDSASKHQCALVSSIPIKPIVLPDISNPGRHCAGLIESYCNGGIRKIVVCNIYGPSGD